MSDLPEGWEERTSRSTGQNYYLNKYTKQSQWDKPTSPAVAQVGLLIVLSFVIFETN